jgi:hypothetical protein
MKTDKEIALQLLDCLEEYYLRYTLLETMLDAHKVPGWRQQFEEVFPFQPARDSVRRRFQPIRDRILGAPDLSTAVRNLLEAIPKGGPKA